jgi:hypothetical protein
MEETTVNGEKAEKTAVETPVDAGKAAETPADEAPDLGKLQMGRCLPVFNEILDYLAANKPPVGNLDVPEAVKAYDELAKVVIGKYLSADLQRQDCEMVQGMFLQMFSLIFKGSGKELWGVENALKATFNSAEAKKWGKSPSEVTLKELDSLLKE